MLKFYAEGADFLQEDQRYRNRRKNLKRSRNGGRPGRWKISIFPSLAGVSHFCDDDDDTRADGIPSHYSRSAVTNGGAQRGGDCFNIVCLLFIGIVHNAVPGDGAVDATVSVNKTG